MADTIITNSPDKNGGDSAGWVVALVVIIALVVGGVLLYQNGFFRGSAPAPADNTNINVTVPNPITPAPTGDGTPQ